MAAEVFNFGMWVLRIKQRIYCQCGVRLRVSFYQRPTSHSALLMFNPYKLECRVLLLALLLLHGHALLNCFRKWKIPVLILATRVIDAKNAKDTNPTYTQWTTSCITNVDTAVLWLEPQYDAPTAPLSICRGAPGPRKDIRAYAHLNKQTMLKINLLLYVTD